MNIEATLTSQEWNGVVKFMQYLEEAVKQAKAETKCHDKDSLEIIKDMETTIEIMEAIVLVSKPQLMFIPKEIKFKGFTMGTSISVDELAKMGDITMDLRKMTAKVEGNNEVYVDDDVKGGKV